MSVKSFRNATSYQAQKLVTCGFELETQETEGMGRHSDGESVRRDQDEIDADVAEEVKRMRCSFSAILSRWQDEDRLGPMADTLDPAGTLRAAGVTGLDGCLSRGFMTSDTRDHIASEIQSDAEDNVETHDVINAAEYMQEQMPQHVECGEDGSVDGFEFRTIGALSFAQFKQAATDIFRLSHDIDTRCSFHIHLAVRGIKHKYSPLVQQACVEYLTNNMGRVPTSVRERWAEENEYISELRDSLAKFSFVRGHPQGTWEFRCFGNVQSAAEGMVCLKLAIEALHYALRVVAGSATLVLPADTPLDTWYDLVREALETGENLTDVLDASLHDIAA